MQDLQVALQPVLSVIADVISKIAEWVSNNPKLAATLTAVAMAIGIISGALWRLLYSHDSHELLKLEL